MLLYSDVIRLSIQLHARKRVKPPLFCYVYVEQPPMAISLYVLFFTLMYRSETKS